MNLNSDNIVEVDTSFGQVTVVRNYFTVGVVPLYEVMVDGKSKHPQCTAEDAMRALAHYLNSESYKLSKLTAAAGIIDPDDPIAGFNTLR